MVHFLPKVLRLKRGGAKLASCPRRQLTLLHPWVCGLKAEEQRFIVVVAFQLTF